MILHPNIDPKIVSFDNGMAITWYSLSYVLGITLGWIYANKTRDHVNFGLSKNEISNFITYAMLGIIIGGRLGYVLFYDLEYHIKNPLDILKTYNGGMSFHGGVIGVLLSSILFSTIYKVNFLSLLDVASLVAPIGLLFGRIANFINCELYGRVTKVPWGVLFPYDDEPRHPSQIYESLTEGLLLLIILYVYGYRKNNIIYKGKVTGLFAITYGGLRIFNEFFREPDSQIGYILKYFTLGQVLSVPLIFIGFMIMRHSSKHYNE